MKGLTHIGIAFAILLAGSGCAYQGTHTFSNTRKLLESEAPGVTRTCFSPFLLVGEAVWSPATAYIDSVDYAADKENVYLSYVGLQTIIASDMHPAYKFAGGLMVSLIDTAWFPIAGTVDTIKVLARDEPSPTPAPEKETMLKKPRQRGSRYSTYSPPN